jgi:hypothetical protein
MRKTVKSPKTTREIDPSKLPAAQGGATLSVGNLLLSIGTGFDGSQDPR